MLTGMQSAAAKSTRVSTTSRLTIFNALDGIAALAEEKALNQWGERVVAGACGAKGAARDSDRIWHHRAAHWRASDVRIPLHEPKINLNPIERG